MASTKNELQDEVRQFLSIPWCATLVGEVRDLVYLFPDPNLDSGLKTDLFQSQLLRKEGGLKGLMVFARPESARHYDDTIFKIRRLQAFIDVGINVSGWTGVSHGGFTSYLVDTVGGWVAQCNILKAIEEGELTPQSGAMTKSLEVEYLKPVLVPRVLLLTATIDKVTGRRIDISVTIEDERRIILSRGKMVSILVAQPSKM
jgi:acyl-coenzyme A thioesterase PaaI-like protein